MPPFAQRLRAYCEANGCILDGAAMEPGRPKRRGRSLAWKHPPPSGGGAPADGLGPKPAPKPAETRRRKIQREKGEEDRIMGLQPVGPAAEKTPIFSTRGRLRIQRVPHDV